MAEFLGVDDKFVKFQKAKLPAELTGKFLRSLMQEFPSAEDFTKAIDDAAEAFVALDADAESREG
jgi:hypothetical protein